VLVIQKVVLHLGIDKPINLKTNQMKNINYAELNQMCLEDLMLLYEQVVEVIKIKRQVKELDIKEELYVGANVRVNHPTAMGKECRVQKINRSKADILIEGKIYSVSLTMIEIIK